MSDETVEIVHRGKFLEFKKKGTWEFVERPHGTGVVTVLAITDRRELVLVEQLRPALDKRVIEMPAGLSGDIAGEEHEALAVAAQRELREETGYEADDMEYLTEGPSSAGLTTEMITFFRARGLRKVGDGGGNAGENITVHLVPLESLDAWIAAKRAEGCVIDYKIYAALCFEYR
jgi:ADP-ribose pyrophosphatase